MSSAFPVWTAPHYNCAQLSPEGQLDLGKFAELLRSRSVPRKDPYFCIVGLKDESKPRRSKDNIMSVHALCLDSDQGYPYSEAYQTLTELGHPCVMYRSFSDMKEKDGLTCERFRVVLPLAEPIPTEQWGELYGRAAKIVLPHTELDLGCKDASRAWFFPPKPEVDILCGYGPMLSLVGVHIERVEHRAKQIPLKRRGSVTGAVFDHHCSPESLAAILEGFGFSRHSVGTWNGLSQIRMTRPGKRIQKGCSLTVMPGRKDGAWASVFSSSIPGLLPGSYCASSLIECLCEGKV